MNVQRRIKKIMTEVEPAREIALRELARELGCSLSSTYSGSDDGRKHLEEEVVRRIQEAARSMREARLWWIAVFSAISSVTSSFAAWAAVIFSFRPN